jgi:hypothetical protein
MAGDASQSNSLKPRLLSDPQLHVQNALGAEGVAREDLDQARSLLSAASTTASTVIPKC